MQEATSAMNVLNKLVEFPGRPESTDGSIGPRVARPARQVRTVAVFGLFGSSNHGNEGSLETMLDLLGRERPDTKLICICANPERVAENFGIATAPISRSRNFSGRARAWNRILLKVPGKIVDAVSAFRHLRRTDVMVIPGTGILDDFGERPSDMPLHLFAWCLIARAARVPVCFVSIGAGPIRNPTSRWLMVSAARLASFRSYRDQISKDFMDGAGVDTSCDLVQPDLVFKMPVPVSTPAHDVASGRLRVGLGVMGYRGWYGFSDEGDAIFRAYTNKIVCFVTFLIDLGHEVRLLVGDTGDDGAAVDAILNGIAAERPEQANSVLARPLGSLRELMEQIAHTDIVVATRFHNVVCALKMGRPTISLGYAYKNDVLMAEMGLSNYCDHVEQFEVETLIRQFSELASRRKEYERRISAQSRAFAEQLDRQDSFLLSKYF